MIRSSSKEENLRAFPHQADESISSLNTRKSLNWWSLLALHLLTLGTIAKGKNVGEMASASVISSR